MKSAAVLKASPGNSKKNHFNDALREAALKAAFEKGVPSAYEMAQSVGAPREVCQIFSSAYHATSGTHDDSMDQGWAAVHVAGWFKNKEDHWVKRKFSREEKAQEASDFQSKRETPPDPRDGHVHQAAFDEDGNGGTSEAGSTPHVHSVFGFKVQPYYKFDPATGEYVSVHPGSLAFEDDTEDIVEMEIFRAGTHNKMEFDEESLEEIASNFHKLKAELRPKLKITHRDHQEKIAGLASYGDVVDVFTRAAKDGVKRLFAKISHIPKEVKAWIHERRFPERSIELYPEFQLGTDEKSPVYKNVLKAIALLGAEMPAVTGMAPIMLEECIECQGTVCIRVFKSGETQSDSSLKTVKEESVTNKQESVPDEMILSFEAMKLSVENIS